MTAQRGEPALPDDREWVPDDEVTCLYCQRYKNRKVCRCGDPNPPRTNR